jgi:VanZ family protein
MKKLATPRLLWIGMGYFGCLLIIILSLVPGTLRPHSGIGGHYEHWIAYTVVGLAFGMGYAATRRQLCFGLALTLGAGGLELLQNFVPGRSPEVVGFLASAFGAWCGFAVALFASAFLRAATE